MLVHEPKLTGDATEVARVEVHHIAGATRFPPHFRACEATETKVPVAAVCATASAAVLCSHEKRQVYCHISDH